MTELTTTETGEIIRRIEPDLVRFVRQYDERKYPPLELGVDEVHAPAFRRTDRNRRRPAMQGELFAPRQTHEKETGAGAARGSWPRGRVEWC